MKPGTLALCLLCFLPCFSPADTIDIDAARSAEQLRRGVQAFHRGYYTDALASLEKAVTFQPGSFFAQAWLGRTLWKSGYEPEALKTWEQLVSSSRNTGKDTSLIRDWIQVLGLRRGLVRESAPPQTWAVSAEIDGTARGGYPFMRPTSVRPRADGSFWVAAFGSNAVLRFDANFRLLATLKGGLEGFDRPYDVFEADDGSVYISEYGANRISVCNPRGDRVRSFGRKGRAEGLLLGPQYLAPDGRGYLWVTDWGNSRVAKFDLDGNYILSIAGISGPTGIAVHESRVYVSEKSGKRVRVFDLNGNALSTLGEGTLQAPEGLSFTDAGALLVADSNRILACDVERETWVQRGDTRGHTSNLVHQAAGVNGDILAVDFDLSKVILLSDVSALYAGLVVRVERVNSAKFPEVYVDVSVENRLGRPIVGLGINNFIVTESRYSVGVTTLVSTSSDSTAADVALLVERSPGFDAFRGDAEKAIGDLYGLVTRAGRMKAVSAGAQPALEADFGETRLRFVAQALQAEPSAKWRFDVAARLAGSELVTGASTARKAIVFFSAGTLGSGAFTTYSLAETAAFLKNNGIAFSPVFFGQKGIDQDLAFLASETGGKVYSVFAPGGMEEVVRDIKARVGSAYTLRYRSPSAADFGDAYIPLEVEATLQRVSGRDESGYYAPPSP